MKTIALAVLALAVALPLRAAEQKDKFKLIHVSDLASALKSEKKPAVFDANTKDVRKKYGVVPGATLLTSSSKYDPAKTLPADKATPLVFYCANTKCMASHQAAEKAVGAGYQDVSVMSDGIMGWKEAGQPTEAVQKASKKS